MVKYQLEIVGLMESRVRRRNQGKVMRAFEKQWRGHLNTQAGGEAKGDSIWALWNPQLWEADILVMHKKLLHIMFRNWRRWVTTVTFVYIRGTEVERRELWDSIGRVATISKDKNWLILGDFNKVLSLDERRGLGVRSDSVPVEFRQAIDTCELIELCTQGGFFT